MAEIKLLSQNMANLIAAGEVVERPSSVVKELVENSIDAGASSVTVEIQNGGMSLIRVTDNGCGIPPDEIATAFLRHATSKISTANDLEAIGSYGFRGEALAAIAAVSRVSILSRTADGEGVSMELEAGTPESPQEAGCPKGTTVMVRDLFYNVPARHKFIKSSRSESSHAAAVCEWLALSHPEIAFRLIKDGREDIHTPGNGSLASCIYCLYGSSVAGCMIKTNAALGGVEVTGYISRPDSLRSGRSMQIYFVNGRPIRSTMICRAFEESYQGYASFDKGRYPFCVLNIKLPLSKVDVNVHPSKMEVKFSDEGLIYNSVHHAVRTALLVTNTYENRPEFTLRPDEISSEPEVSGDKAASDEKSSSPIVREIPGSPPAGPVQEVSCSTEPPTFPSSPLPPEPLPPIEPELLYVPEPEYIPVSHTNPAVEQDAVTETASGQETDSEPEPISESVPFFKPEPVIEQKTIESFKASPRVIGETMQTYIIAEYNNELLMIDKHAAHERMIFNELSASHDPIARQMLLIPQVITPGSADKEMFLRDPEFFEQAGLLAEDFGGGSVIVREIPFGTDAAEAEGLFSDLADVLRSGSKDASNLREKMLHTVACRRAIKAGDKTSFAELESIARRVLEDDNLFYCPHGRPVAVRLTRREIEKQFKRIQ